ncbi:unnamed protein product [Rotaria magnacalcarata]|uniref:EF-hand domain-containing protein n=1 Tax=Rotaria magnacalcarata TaxID=392030 RepID=A0A815N061_9BILA|nr:unnamed protein product [Rotaria magnacalcarata]CAF1572458.1 unnamed protein product [Rotaria magnacalcarata]CAF2124559.1 unnamed protein product [Rotaria magnacalcarata]
MGNRQNKESSTDLTPQHIAVLKANTKLNEEEIHKWHAKFIRDSPNGKLDKKTFVEAYKNMFPHGKVDKYAKYAFDTFDANRDGTIDFDEFLLTVAVTSGGDLSNRLDIAFDMYDISNDGLLTESEITKVITAMYDLVGETDRSGDRDPHKRATEIIAKLDINHDKKLNKLEFVAGCKNDPVIRQMLVPHA